MNLEPITFRPNGWPEGKWVALDRNTPFAPGDCYRDDDVDKTRWIPAPKFALGYTPNQCGRPVRGLRRELI